MLPSVQKLQEAIEVGCYGGGSEKKVILKNYLNSIPPPHTHTLNYYSAPAYIKTTVYCILKKKIRRLNPSFCDIRFSHHLWVCVFGDGVSTSLEASRF